MSEPIHGETIQRPDVRIDAVHWADIPERAGQRLLADVRLWRGISSIPDDFSELYCAMVAGDEDTRTYAGIEALNPAMAWEPKTLIHVVNVTTDGRAVKGYGTVRYGDTNQTPGTGWGEPFVAWTETMHGFLRQGVARHRLLAMAALTQVVFGRQLHSHTLFETYGEYPWLKLVSQGLAEHCTGADGKDQYRML